MGSSEIGRLIRERRALSSDPATGEPYTQQRIADVIGRSRQTVTALEKGAVDVPPPKIANKLADILPVSVEELLLAAGYHLRSSGIGPEEAKILELWRHLPARNQAALLLVARGLLGLRLDQG